jgi:radical SAM superfamily enzyme YgiQ (UPF0313 family)
MICGTNLAVALLHCGNVNPANKSDNAQKNIFFMPMGLFTLASELKKCGVDVEIVHGDIEAYSGAGDSIDFANLDSIGLDCHWSNQSLSVVQTAALAKTLNPDIFVFLGGYTASYFAAEIVQKFKFIDAVIAGEGEVAIIELCRALAASKAAHHPPELDNVPNLVWRDANQQVRINPVLHVATSETLSRMEYAEIALLRNWSYYRDLSHFWSRFPEINSESLFLLEVGRGCRYNCSFCGGSAAAQFRINKRKGMALRSIDSVVSTIRTALTYGFSMFYTCYEEPGVSELWYIELFEMIRRERLDITFGYGSWKLPTARLIDAMSESCKNAIIEVSPETSNEQLRRRNKDSRLYYSNNELESCLDYIGTKGNCKAQIYFGYFLPLDTTETVSCTMEYLSQLRLKYGTFSEIRYSNLSTDPGSLLFVRPEQYQIDIEVRSFSDYLSLLETTYVARKNHKADMTAFRPNSMTKEMAGIMSRKVSAAAS